MLVHIYRMALAISLCAFVGSSAHANVLNEMPNTEACRVMKNDIDPNMESKQNRDDIDFMYRGTMRQGRDGDQCNIFRRNKEKLRTDSALNLSGISKYSRERVFAWGRLCLLDWCDMSSSEPPPKTQEIPPKSEEDNTWKQPLAPPPKTAPPPAKREYGQYTLVVCNYTNIPILYLAYALLDRPSDDEYTLRAWSPIPRGQCLNITRDLGEHSEADVWYRVEGDITRGGVTKRHVLTEAGRTISLCVGINHVQGYHRALTTGYKCRPTDRHEVFWRKGVGRGIVRMEFRGTF